MIAGLAIVWKYTADPRDRCSGREGRPRDDLVRARGPDWYFYFLFYLLRIFKWPETVILATVGIPTILLILLLALPFVDLRMERRLSRRPGRGRRGGRSTVLSMGVLTYKGATAKEAIASEVKAAIPSWAKKQGFAEQQGGARRREPLRRVRPARTATPTSAPAAPTSARPT